MATALENSPLEDSGIQFRDFWQVKNSNGPLLLAFICTLTLTPFHLGSGSRWVQQRCLENVRAGATVFVSCVSASPQVRGHHVWALTTC